MKERLNYRHVKSKDGSLTIHIKNSTADRIRVYCEQQNVCVLKFVEKSLNEQLDILEREALSSMTKEMLIELIVAKKK